MQLFQQLPVKPDILFPDHAHHNPLVSIHCSFAVVSLMGRDVETEGRIYGRTAAMIVRVHS